MVLLVQHSEINSSDSRKKSNMTSDAQILINETASEVGSYRENSSNNSPTGHFLRCNSNICVLPTKKRFSFMFRRKRCIILKSTHLFCSLAFLTKYVYSFVNFWWLRYHSIHKYFSFHNELSFLIAFTFSTTCVLFLFSNWECAPALRHCSERQGCWHAGRKTENKTNNSHFWTWNLFSWKKQVDEKEKIR